MTDAEILELYDLDCRRRAAWPGFRREELPDLIRSIDPAGGEGCIEYSRLDADRADERIREQIIYFDGINHDFEWKVFEHDRPADLAERLRALGFEIEEPEAVMALDLEGAEAPGPPPAGIEVRRIADAAGLDEVAAVHAGVWGGAPDRLIERLARSLRESPESIAIYTARAGGPPASCAWVYFLAGSRFAYLFGGSTLPAQRRRGLYTALLAARAAEARRRGARFLVVDAGTESRPILEKRGFRAITRAWACRRRAGG